ncbi:SDR family oxidoreductase (plasmid) [Rhodococcus erythropolis]|uniref:SDR family NAD(P)-dependent oxidoreductase n=1 Tax=Rhodococcus TaxID=1827 RepID=UPI0012462EA6|nr:MULTISPECIES: SDR family NAD(P)-dependent oxidoreductase [Rhodococcus]MCJ0949904.1 SDR family oxidoreductase [Rhodococcus sp. ARC_M8]MCQ4152100.1 SDR family oxidoreductase [Rhodococcus qingshengii]MDJ0441226.1 SDR family NAD(P)-dependent oxidoreductase [Rhodococcus qingshengii]QEX08436.1 SDR family oxidoreductase [Rhodococcus erythropolis]
MPPALNESVVVVAGGARGIGRATALRLAERGARVAVLDVDLSAAAEFDENLTAASVEDELKDRAGDGLCVQVDLTDPEATERAFAEVVNRFGHVDHLFIPAGGAITPYSGSAASQTSHDAYSKLVAVNMTTVVNCCRSAVPYLCAAGGGTIITVSSGSGFKVAAGGYIAGYAMSKAAVLHYSKYLAVEVGKHRIRVNCIAPGVIRTSRLIAQSNVTGFVASDDDLALIPLQRQGEPSDVADVVELLLSPLAGFLTGQLIAIDGGASIV